MKSYLLQNESDIQLMRDLLKHLPYKPTVVDFSETIQLASVRATTRLWQADNGTLAGFAYLDDFNNLRFEIAAASRSEQLETAIIEWGVTCIKKRNADTGNTATLDACFSVENAWQISLLDKFGFERENFRTLGYMRSLDLPLSACALPQGYTLRCVAGTQEVEALVALHRVAFGTEYFNVAQRLSIMNVPEYEQALDLVAIAPNGELAAFCICGIEDEPDAGKVGYTDPIGTHPQHQRKGLGKALVAAGLQMLKDRGVPVVELGTNSNNIPMQQLATTSGFKLVSEKLWFAKKVTI